MRMEQRRWRPESGWSAPAKLRDAGLVLVFGGSDVLADATRTDELRKDYPEAVLFGASTAGEICGAEVTDGCVVCTAVRFDSTRVSLVEAEVDGTSYDAGETLGRLLPKDGLAHALVLSDGQAVNGSDLVRGIVKHLPAHVALTGGLAGDGARFARTFVVSDGAPRERRVALLGLYGERLRVGYGSLGGWDSFGPLRLVTRSRGNVLYELDGKPALALYKTYLGEHAAGLPSTGLLFPLSVRLEEGGREVVRTILSVNEKDQSLTFAGDVPEGAYARLMKANFDRLVDGASGAAQAALAGADSELALLISCVGRKLVLGARTEDELEAVRDVLPGAALAGFYSYGEICPAAPHAGCDLHNQTMTITTFTET